MNADYLTRTRTTRPSYRPTLRVERMECRNGPSSLLDPLFALFDWGSAATEEVIDAATDSDAWQPVYVGTPGGLSEESNPVAQAPGVGGPPAVPNTPPKIVDYTWSMNGGVYTFTGTVQDENPGGLTVTLGGIPALQGKTVVTDASGNFTYSVYLSTNPNEYGRSSAVTRDAQGLDSPIVYASVF